MYVTTVVDHFVSRGEKGLRSAAMKRARAAGKESVMQLSLQRTTSDRRASGRGAEFEKTNNLTGGGTRDPDGWAHVPGPRTEATCVSGAYFMEQLHAPEESILSQLLWNTCLGRRIIALHHGLDSSPYCGYLCAQHAQSFPSQSCTMLQKKEDA